MTSAADQGSAASGTGPPPPRGWRYFVPLLLLFVGLRLAHSLTAVASYDNEDGYTLAAAFELLHGDGWPYQAYLLSDWEGGTLPVVLLAAPLCWLLGPSLLAIKLTGLAVSCVTLTGLFLLCRDTFGLRAGLIACVIFIFFPPPIYTYSVTAHGFHSDSMALQTFFLWRLALCVQQRPARWLPYFVAGALGGLAIWFAYISMLAVLAGMLAWLVCWIWRRERRHLRGFVAFAAGGMAGSLPWWLYNALNEFRGFNVYHGKLSKYLEVGGLAEKVQFFKEHTLKALLYYTNPFDPSDALYGVFEGSFWLVGAAAILAPPIYWLQARLRRRQVSAAAALAPRYIDWVVPLLVLLSLAIFFNSSHPVGPAHIVPMLVLVLVAVAGRLALLWERGWLPGKVLVLLALGALVLYGGAWQLREIQPYRLGVSRALDGRNYPLFLFRALDALGHIKDPHQEAKARELLLALPPELALDHKDFVHTALSPAYVQPDPTVYLRQYLAEPRHFGVPLDRAEAVGLGLARLLQKKQLTLPRALTFTASLSSAQMGAVVEMLGFYLGTRRDLLPALRQTLAGRPALLSSMERRLAFGLGRARFLPALFESHGEICGHERLPRRLHADYIQGVGHSVAVKMIRPVPRYSERPICAHLQRAFWQGVKRAPPPSERRLVAGK